MVDQQLLIEMREKGYSRIPIYYKENRHLVFGIMLLKSLVGLEASQLSETTIGQLISAGQVKIREPIYIG